MLDLFTPTDPLALFATYHGIEWRHDGTVRTKLYLNPAASGRPPGEVVKQALTGLGLAADWASAPPGR